MKKEWTWTPTEGEKVWIKVFSNWSSGTYIGFDAVNLRHVVIDSGNPKGGYLVSPDVLHYDANPNELKQETLDVPNELDMVLAKINHQNDLGLSEWYEVVYYSDNKWSSFYGSKTFQDGEIVIEWKYCKDLF